MQNLLLQVGDMVKFRNVSLPKVRLRVLGQCVACVRACARARARVRACLSSYATLSGIRAALARACDARPNQLLI
jgi:hypothetical protein